MVNQRFRAVYLAALIVFCIGLLGTVLVPKAHASPWKKRVVIAAIAPDMQQRLFSSSKPLIGFASLGLLSSAGLALLYSRSRA